MPKFPPDTGLVIPVYVSRASLPSTAPQGALAYVDSGLDDPHGGDGGYGLVVFRGTGWKDITGYTTP